MSDIALLNLHPNLNKAMEKLGFEAATEIQEKTIPLILEGKDVSASAKTGSGKTAAFILPMLHSFLQKSSPNTGTRGLILVPTRELALQIQKVFEQLAGFTQIKAGLIIGGEAYRHQISTFRKNPEVLIATPGRLLEHIEKGNTYLEDLEVLVLDEADRMLDMGFADAVKTIANNCNQERQNLLFSATLNHKKISQVMELLSDPIKIEVGGSHRQEHADILQQLILADDDKHKQKLTYALIAEQEVNRVFVFCKTREQCQQLTHFLQYKKLNAEAVHSEVPQSDRKQIMTRFRNGHVKVLVTTDLAARGLDVPETDLIINYAVAQSGDDHVHRVGRTGRAGSKGRAVTLVSAIEWNLMASIERYLKLSFARLQIDGLIAKYKGPAKVKNSGKAVGKKKKKPSRFDALKQKASGKKPQSKSKKPAGKPKSGSSANAEAPKRPNLGDGSGVLKRKRT